MAVVRIAVGVGFGVGVRSSVGTKHARTHEGTAVRLNGVNDLAAFDGEDGTQAAFGIDDTWWESAEVSGQGGAPCLHTVGNSAVVEVGLMRIANPSGGWHEKIVWVRCL